MRALDKGSASVCRWDSRRPFLPQAGIHGRLGLTHVCTTTLSRPPRELCPFSSVPCFPLSKPPEGGLWATAWGRFYGSRFILPKCKSGVGSLAGVEPRVLATLKGPEQQPGSPGERRGALGLASLTPEIRWIHLLWPHQVLPSHTGLACSLFPPRSCPQAFLFLAIPLFAP